MAATGTDVLSMASGAAGPGWLGLAVALGAGLLIGLERERRKGRGPQRGAAGIRSFTLVALSGALAQMLGQPALVALGGLAVVGLAALAYWRSLAPAARPAARAAPAGAKPPPDPGMTTELALFVTYLVGVLAVQRPAMGAGAGVTVAVLLAARGKLHHLATRLLSEQELHDGLLLAALGLVLLPLLPQQPVPWLAGLQPSVLAGLVLLILLLQAAGHMALRLAGPRAGLALSGLMSGFVSSTATVAALGARSRAEPALAASCTAGAVLSTAATWVQAGLMLAALAPDLARQMLPTLAAGATLATAAGAWLAHRAAGPHAGAAGSPARGGALQVRQALVVALMLTGVTLLVHQANLHFGQTGALAGVLLAGLADAHAGVTAVGALAAQAQWPPQRAAAAVLLAIGANSLTRVVVARASGGAAYAGRLAAALSASLAAAVGAAALGGVAGFGG